MKKIVLLVTLLLNVSFVDAQWQNSNFPIADCISCFATSDTTIYVGTAASGVFFSNDDGISWIALNNGLTNLTVSALLINGQNVFAGTKGGVFLLSNSGSSWNAVNNGLTNLNISSLVSDGTNIYAGAYNGNGSVFITSNNGGSWTSINNGLLPNANVYAIATSGSNVFVGLQNQGGVFLSSNNGGLWTAVNSGLTNKNVMSLMVSGANIFAGTDSAVYLSNNNGGGWNLASNGLTNIQQIWQFTSIGSNIFVSTWSSGVFVSTNNGLLWTPINTGLTGIDLRIVSLVISGTKIFAGVCSNYGAIWQRPLSELGLVEIDEVAKKGFLKMYPNPATDELNIIFNDATATEGMVEIHDLLGKLIERVPLKSGIVYNYNTQSLQKSIYLVSLYINGKLVDNQKLVLIK